MGLQVRNDSVFHLALRLQNSFLIIDKQLLEPCILQPDVALQTAIVEDIPLESAEQAECFALVSEQITSAPGRTAQ